MEKKKCPACGWEITDGGKTVRVRGESVVVCNDDCAAQMVKKSEKGKR